MILAPLGIADGAAAWRFCQARPHQTMFIAGWLHDGGLREVAGAAPGWLLGEWQDQNLVGLVWISDGGITLPVLSPKGLKALARVEAQHPGTLRILVGERDQIRLLFQQLEPQGAKARLMKDQLALWTQTAPSTATLPLCLAGPQHLPELVRASAAMAVEEAGDDPAGRNPEVFRQKIEARAARGRDFLYWTQERLLFKANVAAISPLGGQLEGIYTSPAYRRLGLGRAGTGTLTRWVLERGQNALLHVNEDNAAARTLYESLGYQQVLLTRTLFLW